MSTASQVRSLLIIGGPPSQNADILLAITKVGVPSTLNPPVAVASFVLLWERNVFHFSASFQCSLYLKFKLGFRPGMLILRLKPDPATKGLGLETVEYLI